MVDTPLARAVKLEGEMLRDTREWLEADGRGGFASGTVTGIRTRRYHALLLHATRPPAARVVMVNGFEAWLETDEGTFPVTAQRYTPDVVSPRDAARPVRFELEPWPIWTIGLPDGRLLRQEICAIHGSGVVVVEWSLPDAPPGTRLHVRPLLSGRDLHDLHHENPAFSHDEEREGERVIWRPYAGLPAIHSIANATYVFEPQWYRNFQYDRERDRGLDYAEDLASPGALRFELGRGPAVWILAAANEAEEPPGGEDARALELAEELRERERRRRSAFASPLHRAADQYVIRRKGGCAIISGYPWFGEWGRDSFVALRGLCLATSRLADARDVLVDWSRALSAGMLPNRFPDSGEPAEYNSVDASLFFAVAVHDLLARADAEGFDLGPGRRTLEAAVLDILSCYSRGTSYGIRAEEDGLLAAGEPGIPLTWMDAKLGEWLVTPRIGKPVEVQALWINALAAGAALDPRWEEPLARARASFQERFWNAGGRFLYDVVDVDHRPGAVDVTLRPNQVLAVGGLPFPVLEDAERARAVVEQLEARLWTPLGLRSLAPDHPAYSGEYRGTPGARDSHYHQGPVWPWLAGAFVQAWLRVRRNTPEARAEARTRFLDPLLAHLSEYGLGHVSELADGDPPHTPRGCPFQAWSVGELLRIVDMLEPEESRDPSPPTGGTVERRAGARSDRERHRVVLSSEY